MSKQIEHLLKEFDFKKVRKAMLALNWQWYLGEERGSQVPLESELRNMARKLLKDVVARQYDSIGTGGFYAERWKDGTLRLSFVLTDWETSVDEVQENEG